MNGLNQCLYLLAISARKYFMIQISTVIPTKNRAKTLPYCLDSILNQTYCVNEIIVVDDNSTDDTYAVVLKYKNRGVRYVKLASGKGAQAARNFGIKISNNDWIAFQDSDDIWFPNKIEMQYLELRNNNFLPDILIHTAGVKRSHDGNLTNIMNALSFEGDCYKKLLIQHGPMFQSILVNKKKLLEINMLDEFCPSYQEWDTAIRLAKVCNFVHIKQPLFEWVWHDGDTISKDERRDFSGFEYVIKKHQKEIKRLHGISGWRRLQMTNIVRALNSKLFLEVILALKEMPTHSSKIVALIFAKLKISVRGTGKIINFLTKSPI